MSSTARQNNLLLAEDWQKIYQSFKNADFQSYDFDNLRRTMVDYIRTNFPEDFNDYIESSEYLALIDLIAYVGQSIAFRVDLNARENFLELASRRDSVLRLARMIGYNASRNVSASGLLKFNVIKTTESLLDSNGRNLAGQYVTWNDPSNNNWYDQFITVLNAALPSTQQFGNPADQATIYNTLTSQYRINGAVTNIPVYGFTQTVAGRQMDFEITSTSFNGETFLYEEAPKVGNSPAFIYTDDGYGAGSPGTGFFFRFTQGTLNSGTFTVTNPSSNENVDITTQNINNTDVWLYGLNENGLETVLWTPVSGLAGNNAIYNSLSQNINTIYQVVTRAGDAISLSFGDGTFGKLPLGSFKIYYRIGNNLSYTINPSDIVNVVISIPYVSAVSGQSNTLSISLNLVTSVVNATQSESNASVQKNAPQTYYTQDRMITGEDYNINPLSATTQVAKVKSVNRSSSGISRYFDLTDPSGKYSSTTLFADDGIIYQDAYASVTTFSYLTQTDIQATIYNTVYDILNSTDLRNFYYANFVNYLSLSANTLWYGVTTDSNTSSGYVGNVSDNTPFKVGPYTTTNLQYITTGALVRFQAPSGYYFNTAKNNTLTAGTATVPNSVSYLWAHVVSVNGNGTITTAGVGPIVMDKAIPNGSIITQIIPEFTTTINSTVIASMIDLIFSNVPFALRYDASTQTWQIIFETNINTTSAFSLGNQGDLSNSQLDASWMLLFTTNNEYYTITTRNLRYVFESDKEINFYFDGTSPIYDSTSSQVVSDTIKLLSINTQPDLTIPFTKDLVWQVTAQFMGQDGYIDPKKLVVAFADTSGRDIIADNPQIFLDIVNPSTNPLTKYIVEQKYKISEGQEDYKYIDNSSNTVIILPTQASTGTLSNYNDGQYFYFVNIDVVKQYNATTGLLSPTLDYKVYIGRDNLKFQYTHSADYDSRIDPGASNIIDIYVLTNSYDILFRQWISTGATTRKPMPPSQDSLNTLLAPTLNLIKAMSDEIVYHPVNYTLLFGAQADPSLQANFNVMINPKTAISSADVTSRILIAINQFFALDNWDFGDTFYFSELSTYVMTQLAPDITSFVIVPIQPGQYFGGLFEIQCSSDSIFLSCATATNIVIVSGLTSTNLKTVTGEALTTVTNSQQIISANYGTSI